MNFWERTKDRIKELKTTQDAIAQIIEVSPRTFRGWLSREIMPNADQVQLVARALKVETEWLIFGTQRRDDSQIINLPTALHRQTAAKLSGLNESELKIVNLMLDEILKK